MESSAGSTSSHRELSSTDFQQQVARTPQALAVCDDQQQLTYQELDAQSTQLATHLQQQGVRPEQVVGLYCQRSVGWAVAVLALFKAGGVYLPLEPQHPPARLRSMLQQSQCTLLLSSQALTDQLNTALDALSIPVLSLETLLSRGPRAAFEPQSLLSPSTTGLCNLYFGLYWPTQRGDGGASRHA